MKLARALRIRPGDIVTFTGAGGKTTAILRLGQELVEAGYRVIATTTTRFGLDQLPLFPGHLVSPDPEEIEEALARSPWLAVVRELDGEQGKALGFAPDHIASFREHADIILVEGDGSKGRPLKAPRAGEPLIPPETTHLVTVMGLWALGRPMGPATIHRPQLFSALTGLEAGDTITTAGMARLLLHPDGPARGAPDQARQFILLNDLDASLENAEQIADIQNLASRLAAHPRFSAILLGQTEPSDPVYACYGQISAVILAAGGSSRFGSPKQLYSWDGEPLLRHVIQQTLAAPVQQVFVVLGASFEEVAKSLYGLPVTLVYNPDWELGQSTSMQAGLRACPEGTQSALFVLGDQPYLPSALLNGILDTYRRTLASIVAPRHRGRRGNPVLFDGRTWAELQEISGDTGGRPLFQRYQDDIAWVEADETIFFDIDRPAA